MKNYNDSVVAFQNAIKINSMIAQVLYLGESYRKLKSIMMLFRHFTIQ